MRKIGIMGGTFDPIHTGHLMLAEWAADKAGLEQVWLIPTGLSYLKANRDILPGEERLHMAKLAVEGNERLRCMDLEIRREGFTYSYETMELLGQQYPQDRFYFIVGADCLAGLENWKCPERLLASCTLLAAVRGEHSMDELEQRRRRLLERFGGDIRLMSFPQLELSSTEIRERLRRGESVRYMVPEKVLAYIQERGFYHEKKECEAFHEEVEEGHP